VEIERTGEDCGEKVAPNPSSASLWQTEGLPIKMEPETHHFFMSENQVLLLLMYMTASVWLEYKSLTVRNPDAQVGWWAANWIVLCLYTSQFVKLLKSIDYLKDVEEWMVLLLSFFTLVLYDNVVKTIIKLLREEPEQR